MAPDDTAMGSTRHTSFAAACAITSLLLSGSPHAAQDRPPAAPAFRSGVDLVLVDVRVMRDDDAVADLRAADVSLLVDGRPRPIVSLDYVAAAGSAAGSTAVTPSSGTLRRAVLVVDRESLDAADAQQVLDAARTFLEKAPPDYAFAVVTLPLGSNIRFEADRSIVAGDLTRAFVGSERRGPGLEGIAGFGCEGEAASFGCGVRGLPYKIEHQLARSMITGSEWQFRGQGILRDLQGLFRTVAGGPSDVILLTGALPLDDRLRPEIERTLEIARRSRVRVHSVSAGSVSRVVLTPGAGPQVATLDAARGRQHGAYRLPEETGGIERTGASSAGGFFTRLARELSGSYLLTFEPLPSERDEKPHEIVVRVHRQPEPTVHARRTFVLASPDADVGRTVAAAPAVPATPAATAPGVAREAPGLRGILGRASAYVDEFERSLPTLAAEERYVQLLKAWQGAPPRPGEDPDLRWLSGARESRAGHSPSARRRQILSDVLLVQPSGRMWIGVRDVAEVDGRSVRGRAPRVEKLFLSATADDRRRLDRIAAESVRHNLGAARNINVPTFPLQILRGSNIARFEWRMGDQARSASDPASCTVVGLPRGRQPHHRAVALRPQRADGRTVLHRAWHGARVAGDAGLRGSRRAGAGRVRGDLRPGRRLRGTRARARVGMVARPRRGARRRSCGARGAGVLRGRPPARAAAQAGCALISG